MRASGSVSNIRATSIETLPFLIMDTCDTLSSGGDVDVFGMFCIPMHKRERRYTIRRFG